MNRQNPAEDFSSVTQQLQELDRQIPVPFAATAQGMKARLSSPAAPKKSRLVQKWIWSAASLLLVAVIGSVLWPSVKHLASPIGNDTTAGEGVALQMNDAAPKNAAIEESAMIASEEDGFSPPLASPSTSMEAAFSSNHTDDRQKSRIYYPAENYQQIQLMLGAILSPEEKVSSSLFNDSKDSAGSLSISTAGHSYRYSLTSTHEGNSRLDIHGQDGALLSQTNIDCSGNALFVQGQTLVLAGENSDGTLLQFFDVSDPGSPVLQRTFVQQGAYLGAWENDGALLIGSFYQLDSRESFIPIVFDSNENSEKQLEAGQILLSDHCSAASYAVVTAIPLDADSVYHSFAVLGGDNVDFSLGELTISTAGNETDFSVRQEQIWEDLTE